MDKTVDDVDFVPLYDSASDGFCANKFHAACDEVDFPTLTLLRSETLQAAVGGFATVPWRKRDNQFTSDPASFLFRLHGTPTHYDVQTYPPVQANAGIYSGSLHGPVFGRGKVVECIVHARAL